MKSISQYLLEALQQKKLDSEQLYMLANDQIDVKAFALNNGMNVADVKKIHTTLHSGDIVIVSEEQMKSKYSKDDVKKITDDIDKLIAAGPRYGRQMNLSPKEKKQREEVEKQISAETGEPPKKSEVDDSKFVNQCNTDFVGVMPDAVSTYFWKKSGDTCYLYFIINNTEDVEELINQI